MNENKSFSYTFSLDEIKTLLIVLRKCSDSHAESLTKLQSSMQRYVYSMMTIEEAEKFFE